MKQVCILFLWLTTFTLSAQSFEDDFEDGDFSDWSGDDASFIVSSGVLQLNGDCIAGGENYLSIPVSTQDSAVWEFYVSCTFDPSTSNYAKIYLQSNTENLLGDVQGYFIQVGGESGTIDAIKLYRQEGIEETFILSGVEGAVSIAPIVRIKMIRTNEGEWKLFTDYSGGSSFTLESTAIDTEINGGNYFGFVCLYTSTRCTNFFFDDIIVDPLYFDVDAPTILDLTVLNASQVEVIFSENVELTSAQENTNYTIVGIGNPINATRDFVNFNKVVLTFLDDFPLADLLTLTIINVQDLAGNAIISDAIDFTFYEVQQFDLVINEIMADPEPSAGLPELEYIEIFNNTNLPLDLSQFIVKDLTSSSDLFPEIILQPDSFLIITDDANLGIFNVYGNVLYLNNFPSLNNDGDGLTLVDASEKMIHQVNYSSDWYQNAIKEDGGYALEMIDANNPCQGIENWKASTAINGGTPGKINALAANNPDEIAPSVVNAFPSTSDSLIVTFDEIIDLNSIQVTDFFVDPTIGAPESFVINAAKPNTVSLFFSTPFSSQILYTLEINNLTDCAGNTILLFNTIQFGIPEEIEISDLVINEILFNPKTDGADFIEIYNRSNKFIDLSTLQLAEFSLEDSTLIEEFTTIDIHGKILLPNTFAVITSDVENILENYFVNNAAPFLQNTGTPNLPDDEGIVAILNNTQLVIDQFHYYSDWHFALLDDENGVSLERLNEDAQTQDKNNWHSAAEDAHFGTPGFQNSIYGNVTNAENFLQLEYAVFSPDGDGNHDILIINYSTPNEGFIVQLKIFDAAGRQIKHLQNNTQLGRSGFFTWDGLNENNEKSSIGIFILSAEFFDLNGNVQNEKIQFTLLRK